MLAKNVIKNVATYLNLTNLLNSVFLDGDNQPTKQDEAEINTLLSCLNLVINQVATEYINLKNKIKISSISGKIYYSALSSNVVVDVLTVTKNGSPVRFEVCADHIKTVSGDLEVEFVYQPSSCSSVLSNIDFENFKINERVLSYGVVAEYCFLNGNYDDAAIWDNRFKNSLSNLNRARREIKIKQRLWI